MRPPVSTRESLCREVASVTGKSQDVVHQALETFIGMIKTGLHDGKKVRLRGIGRLENHRRKAHWGRDFYRGVPMMVPERTVVFLHAYD